MKQLFLAAACCLFAFASKAQVPVVNIINTKSVGVYVMFYGDNACGATFTSNVTLITSGFAMGGLTPASFTWVGGTRPLNFTGVRIYEGNPSSCTGVGFADIGEACLGLPPSAMLPYLDATCTMQGNGPNNWNSTPAFADFHLHP